MELLQKLGIDWRLIIAQIINFLILLAVLYKFLYKPVLNFLDQRSKRIEDSLEKAQKIDEDFKNSKVRNEALLTEVKKQAAKILEEAQVKSDQIYKDKVAETLLEAKQIVERSRRQIQDDKEKTVKEAKQDIAGLVVSATAKILEDSVTQPVDNKLVESILKKVKL